MGFVRNLAPFVCILGLAIVLGWVVAQIPRHPGADAQLQEQKKAGLFVFNVLDKELYDDCHIKGSIHVPLTELEQKVQSLDKENAEIVIYCSNYLCGSSEQACKKLQSMGFKHVWAYEGGTAEWYQMGLPVEGQSQSSYLTKKIAPPPHDASRACLTVTAQELAQKLQTNNMMAA